MTNERVDRLSHSRDAGVCGPHAAAAFEAKRLGDDADREDAHLASRFGDDRSGAGASAPAHASGEEHHVEASDVIADLLQGFLGRRLADLGLGAGAKPLRHLEAHLDYSFGARRGQRLGVGVARHEFDPGEAGDDHVVDRVSACAADTAHHDAWLQFPQLAGIQSNRHALPLLLGVRRWRSWESLFSRRRFSDHLRLVAGRRAMT
jgi:hypothetical protein